MAAIANIIDTITSEEWFKNNEAALGLVIVQIDPATGTVTSTPDYGQDIEFVGNSALGTARETAKTAIRNFLAE